MAFDKAGWAHYTHGKDNSVPSIHCYTTADAIATVDTTGYFDNGATTNTGMRQHMRVNDLIIVASSTGGTAALGFLRVASNAAGIIDTTDVLAVTATDTD